jgi:hypothetical protein
MRNKPNANAPNKPNFGPGKMKGKCCANKELRQVGWGAAPEKQSQFGRSFKFEV